MARSLQQRLRLPLTIATLPFDNLCILPYIASATRFTITCNSLNKLGTDLGTFLHDRLGLAECVVESLFDSYDTGKVFILLVDSRCIILVLFGKLRPGRLAHIESYRDAWLFFIVVCCSLKAFGFRRLNLDQLTCFDSGYRGPLTALVGRPRSLTHDHSCHAYGDSSRPCVYFN